jgi:hypothetical protein
MAVSTPTQLGDFDTSEAFTNTVTVPSSTPTGDSYLVLFAFSSRGAGANYVSTITYGTGNSNINGSWTQLTSDTAAVSGNPAIDIWYARAASSPAAETCVVVFQNSGPTVGAGLFEVASGFDETTTVRNGSGSGETDTSNTTSTSPSATMAASPLSASKILNFLYAYSSDANMAGAPASGSGYTDLDTASQSTFQAGAAWADGSNGTTYDWTSVDADVDQSILAALEIQEAASAASPIGIEVIRTIAGVTH